MSAAELDETARSVGPALVRLGYLLTGDRQLAQDLVQDSLARAVSRWQQHGPPDHPYAYLRQVLVRQHVSWLRRRSSGEHPAPPHDQPLADRTEEVVLRQVVWSVLAELPRRQRAVLVLRFYEDLTDAQIAAVLGCREGTVRSAASRAIARLRREPQLAELSRPSAKEATS